MENILLKKAIEYANRGWYVFPCREKPSRPFLSKNGKEIIIRPKAPYIKHGFQNASTDVDQISEWWNRYPNAGIGISCGASNLVVLDIDVRDGKQGFENFMKMGISEEGALHAKTPSGGVHIIYKGLMNSHANVKIGVDVRSKGAYIVAPPSWILEDGQKKFYSQSDDWNREPVCVPAELEYKLNWLRGKDKKKETNKKPFFDNSPIGIKRVEKALETLPQWMCDDYFSWVNIGMALKTLGDAGFSLWDKWSKKSDKYDPEALEMRWDKFVPNEITVASIFYYAKKAPKKLYD